MDRLRFGIPSLDFLFKPDSDQSRLGINLVRNETATLSFIGRSGTGKSLLGLHLVSRYLADALDQKKKKERQPLVIFVSTDLTFSRAKLAWDAFWLHDQNKRPIPFTEAPARAQTNGLALELERHSYGSDDDITRLAKAIYEPSYAEATGKVLFVDLATSTAGDDWGLLTRLLALLPPQKRATDLKHLMVIDAVEGLETFAGTIDPHGHDRTRRSRVAQILRTASGRCHIALVLEESKQGEVPAEEYVTDVVVRLWATEQVNYIRRTLEVAKSRGSTHVRGHHNYFIRKGDGKPEWPDDPPNQIDGRQISYFYVVHSLHCRTRYRESLEQYVYKPPEYAPFETPKLSSVLPKNGLPRGKVTVLTGDEATFKARFGRAFLAGGFSEQSKSDGRSEAAVYLTTQNLSSMSELLQNLKCHLLDETARNTLTEENIIFRQLEAHDLNGPALFNIIRRCVESGIAKAKKANRSATTPANLVRVVVDDWTVIKQSYPQVAKDSLFLPYLIRYLEDMAVTCLIIETSPGRPDQIFQGETDRQLRALVRNHLLTWHVSFYGEDRVAIAAVPALKDSEPSVVAELRPPPSTDEEMDERLWADPHFELYMGLESGQPQPVPLEVHLFASPERFDDYKKQTDGLFNQLFAPCLGSDVIKAHKPTEYATLREYTRLHGSVRSNHTVVLQVDEYWQPAHQALRGNVNCPGSAPYLAQATTDKLGEVHFVNDTFREYQLDSMPCDNGELSDAERPKKSDFYHMEGYAEGWHAALNDHGLIPYIWDFGFLLFRSNSWENAVKGLRNQERKLVSRVLNYCTKLSQPKEHVEWITFFRACKLVSEFQAASSRKSLALFDMDLLTPQTFVCLVLEMWATEIRNAGGDGFSRERPKHPNGRVALNTLLLNPISKSALFRVALLLGQVLRPEEWIDPEGNIQSRPAPNGSVAERHWYSTASQIWKKFGSGDDVVVGRLPGCYTSRGDWYLTVDPESRSVRLGERAIDQLCSRKNNVTRLELGIGLPVRDFAYWRPASYKLPEVAPLDLAKKDFYKHLRTALIAVDEASGRRHPMNYEELLNYGACEDSNGLSWLWRSEIPNYSRHDRVWERWLARLVSASAEWNTKFHSKGSDGFKMYEQCLLNAASTAWDWAPPILKPCCRQYDELVNAFQEILKKLNHAPTGHLSS